MKGVDRWKFDKGVTQTFNKHVRQSVPGYEKMQEYVMGISDFFVLGGSAIYDIGCSTAETIAMLNTRHKDKKIRLIGVDESPDMVAKAIEFTRDMKNVQIVHDSIQNYLFKEQSNFILSILTLQFCPIAQRKEIIQKIYDALNQGGAFVIVEKVTASSAMHQEIFTQLYHDLKETNGLTPLEIRQKDKALRGSLVPLNSESNLHLLTQVGFQVDVFLKNLTLLVYWL